MKKMSQHAAKTSDMGSAAFHPHWNTDSVTKRRKWGYAGDLTDTPTIYVGDIDMYIPLEKHNT